MAYESRLELARIMLADFDPAVTAIAAQPFRLVGTDRGHVRRHVPDVLLLTRDGGAVVVDVKAPRKRDDPEVRALTGWTRRTVGLRGWGFEDWYGAPRDVLANVRFLAGYRRRITIDENLIPEVRRAAAAAVSITDLERSVPQADPVLIRPVILYLLWRGELVADLSRPLDGLSVVAAAEPGKARSWA